MWFYRDLLKALAFTVIFCDPAVKVFCNHTAFLLPTQEYL